MLVPMQCVNKCDAASDLLDHTKRKIDYGATRIFKIENLFAKINEILLVDQTHLCYK